MWFTLLCLFRATFPVLTHLNSLWNLKVPLNFSTVVPLGWLMLVITSEIFTRLLLLFIAITYRDKLVKTMTTKTHYYTYFSWFESLRSKFAHSFSVQKRKQWVVIRHAGRLSNQEWFYNSFLFFQLIRIVKSDFYNHSKEYGLDICHMFGTDQVNQARFDEFLSELPCLEGEFNGCVEYKFPEWLAPTVKCLWALWALQGNL